MFNGIREAISPAILAVATILVIISILLLTTVELLRRRSERLRGFTPVSYTHLDVYKRQDRGRACATDPRPVDNSRWSPVERGAGQCAIARQTPGVPAGGAAAVLRAADLSDPDRLYAETIGRT